MLIVYIAHPYRSKTVDGIAENIWKARKVAKKWWKAGYAVFSPCVNSMFMDGIIPDEQFIHADLAILAKCDLLVMSKGWKKSRGCCAELDFAKEMGIKVMYE